MSPTNARRRVAMTCLTGAAVLTLAGTRMPTAALAVITLGLAASCLLGLEAAFWTTATELAPAAPGTAGGLLNLMGNLGGVLSIWLVPVMTEQWGWTPTLSVWGVVAGVAALCWVRVEARATDP
jgi:ACS family glucarate transporter-like MFS transporter